MEPNTWIIGQIIIDSILAGLLIWFVISHYKQRKPSNDLSTAFQKSEIILLEMDRISRALEKNLEEKKDLSQQILGQLDEGLQRADECRQQLQKIIRRCSTRMDHPSGLIKDTGRIRTSIKALLARGLSKEEVARHLAISVGEIELLLKIQGQKGPDPQEHIKKYKKQISQSWPPIQAP